MAEIPHEPYSIINIEPEWVSESEALGSKRKFWYRDAGDENEWLFKFPQENTGQHWAEKIAAEIARRLDILHARVELAIFQETRGSATETFARDGRNLFHGNQILAGIVLGYDSGKKFHQSDHTLANIFLALKGTFVSPEGLQRAKVQFAEYIVFDALIGNTDRHHENWGILRKRAGDRWTGILAPTFDHASSLGREMPDLSGKKCRRRILQEGRIGAYAEKARGAIFWENTDRYGLSPLELARRAAILYPELFKPALAHLDRLDRPMMERIIRRVPDDWMTPLAREFALELMCYNIGELRRIRL